MTDGSWFVYRSPYQGPSGVRVRRLPDRTPLAWFQRMWAVTADLVVEEGAPDPIQAVTRQLDAELGDRLWGLYRFFCTSHACPPVPDEERRRPLPATTWRELKDLLAHPALYGPRSRFLVRMDRHSVRIRDDEEEEEEGTFYFLDDDLVRAAPDRVAYLLRQDWRLPPTGAAGDTGFRSPVEGRVIGGASGGAGTTWLVMPGDGGEAPMTQVAFPGVRLPELAGHLRTLVPGEAGTAGRDGRRPVAWTDELLLVRAMIGAGDQTLGPALRRYGRWGWRLRSEWSFKWLRRPDSVDHATAAARVGRLLESPLLRPLRVPPEPPSRSRVEVGEHLVQALLHRAEGCSYDRWYLFDDVWASTHPELAASLLRYAADWDPLAA
jgi:hypothetical protein